MRPPVGCYWNWSLTKLLSGETRCWQEFGPVLRWRGHCAGTEASLTKKGSLLGVWGSEVAEFGMSQLGSKCAVLVPAGDPVLMLRSGQGNGASQVLCSWRGLSVNAAFLGHALGWATVLPTVCPRLSSDHCFPLCGLFALPFLQEQPHHPLRVSRAKHPDL